MIKIYVVPADYNPYQYLLAKSLKEDYDFIFQPMSKYIFITYLYYLIKASLRGVRIIHIHWLYFLKTPFFISNTITLRISYMNTRLFLFLVRCLRFKVVWTVHNVLPHKQLTSNDAKVRRILASLSDAKIVHAKGTVKSMKKLHINMDNVSIIPHGNFTDIYPDTIARQEARSYLHIPSNATVLLFFGKMEPYKNVPRLIKAYRELSRSHDNLHLVLAGRLVEPRLIKLIDNLKKENSVRLHIHDRYVKDDMVQYFFRAADFAVFPYSNITTSGSILLASMFGVPVIAPRVGGLAELPQDIGKFYMPNTQHELIDAIEKCLNSTKGERKRMSQKSLSYSASLNWKTIGQRTQQVYRKALDRD